MTFLLKLCDIHRLRLEVYFNLSILFVFWHSRFRVIFDIFDLSILFVFCPSSLFFDIPGLGWSFAWWLAAIHLHSKLLRGYYDDYNHDNSQCLEYILEPWYPRHKPIKIEQVKVNSAPPRGGSHLLKPSGLFCYLMSLSFNFPRSVNTGRRT